MLSYLCSSPIMPLVSTRNNLYDRPSLSNSHHNVPQDSLHESGRRKRLFLRYTYFYYTGVDLLRPFRCFRCFITNLLKEYLNIDSKFCHSVNENETINKQLDTNRKLPETKRLATISSFVVTKSVEVYQYCRKYYEITTNPLLQCFG